MKREAGKQLGIAVIGAGRIGTLRARLAAKHPVGRLHGDRRPRSAARARRSPSRPAPISTPATTSRRSSGPEVNAVFVSTPGEPALRAGAPGAGARQAGAVREADRALAEGRRRHPRDPEGDRRQAAHRLQPPLQGMLSARQGADDPRPPRQGGRRARPRLQLARADLRDPEARSRTRRRCSTS